MFCSDTLLVNTLEDTQYISLFTRRKQYLTFKKEKNHWDLKERGLMVWDFKKDIKEILKNTVSTAELFLGFLYEEVKLLI